MKVVDLFSGAGGMSLGAKRAGLDTVAAYDFWQPAVNTYAENFDHKVIQADLSDVEKIAPALEDSNPDLIVGGPPCQDFSHAGSRNEGPRAELTYAFAAIVARASPAAFVMENVPAALKSAAYEKARRLVKQKGYGLTEVTLDASYFGVPQRRKRLFVIGLKGYPDGAALRAIHAQQSLFSLSVRAGVPELESSLEHYYRHPRSYTRRAVFSIDEPSPTVRGTNRPKPSTYVPHPGDSSISRDVRALQARERALIQSFPNDYSWLGSASEIEQMIGNAVPPALAAKVLLAVSRSMSDCPNPRREDALSETKLRFLRGVERKIPIIRSGNLDDYLEHVQSQSAFDKVTDSERKRFVGILQSLQDSGWNFF